jgi:hypothetical protein
MVPRGSNRTIVSASTGESTVQHRLQERETMKLWKLTGWLAAAALTWAFVENLPDLKRYVRITMM